MEPSKQKIKNQLASMRLMYYAMCTPIIIFSGVVYFLVTTGALGQPDYSLAPLLQTVAILVIPATLAGGYFVFKAGVSKIDTKLPLPEKLQKYFVLMMIRGALIESGFLFCFVATILTRELLFLAAAPVMLFIFLLLRPNTDSIVMDLKLTGDDKATIESFR